MDAELASWVTLHQIKGLGNEGLRRLLMTYRSASQVFSASTNSLKKLVKPAVAEAISLGMNEAALAPVSAWLKEPQNSIVTIADFEYPQSLLNIPDPPLLLYVKGRRELLGSPSLAIVGSRNATLQGINNSETFAKAVSAAGLCVVSGLAHGIDAAAHRGGLSAIGSSIAVVGTGLDKIYPSANKQLAHRLANEGAMVSEFPLGTPPISSNFPRRNRIISGMASGCLVVEASLQSGSLISARMALEQGREVFAIPGSIHSPLSKGCHYLIKQGAKLVECAQDILEELGYLDSINKSPTDSKIEHPIFLYLGYDPTDLDSLSERSGLTIDTLSAILLQLELDGCVAALPGGLYQRIN